MRPKAILVSLSLAVIASLALGATAQPNTSAVTAQSIGHPALITLTAAATHPEAAPDLNVVLAKAIWERAEAENAWNAALAANAAKQHKAKPKGHSVVHGEPHYGSGACGGDLPPCSVMMCESRGDTTVYNSSGSGASGKWQIMHSTWDGYGGYDNAADAPESVQDAKAREIYAGGAGRRAWSC